MNSFFSKNSNKDKSNDNIDISPQIMGSIKYEWIEKGRMKNQKSKIDMKYEFPASLQKAKLHAQAVKFGYNRFSNTQIENNKGLSVMQKYCSCCNQQVQKQNIPMCYRTSQIGQSFKLGSHTVMFFSFIKMTILYLTLVFLISGAYNMFMSIIGNYCVKNSQNPECKKNYFGLISSYNKYGDTGLDNQNKIQDILNLVVVGASIIYFLIYRKYQYHIYEIIDAQQQTQDDYTIFVQKIKVLDFGNEKQFNYQNQLKEDIQLQINLWIQIVKQLQDQGTVPDGSLQKQFLNSIQSIQKAKQQPKVRTVSLCFDLTELQKVKHYRDKLMAQEIIANTAQMKNSSYTKKQIDPNNMKQANNIISKLNKTEIQLCQKFALDNSSIFNITHFVGKAFISFEYQHYREHIMKKYENKKFLLKNYKKQLVLQRASHPTDIFWQNMRVPNQQRIKNVVTSFLILGMLIVFSAFALVTIDNLKATTAVQTGVSTQQLILNYGLSIIASFITYGINYGITSVNYQLTSYEKHKTRTHETSSLIIKLIISQFINNAFIYYFITWFSSRRYMGSTGLVGQISILIIVSGFISVANNFVYIKYIFRYVNLYWKYGSFFRGNQANQADSYRPTFQMQLNKDFQRPVFDMATRYSYYLLQFYTCIFYSYLIPVGLPVTAIIFGLQFWIDKYNMFKRSSQYFQFNFELSRIVLKIFQCSLLIFSLGNLLFSSAVLKHTNFSIPNIISLSLSLVYVCITTIFPSSLQQRLLNSYETIQKCSYTKAMQRQKFTQTYWTQNPATVFVREVDLNDKNNFIAQGNINQYIKEQDYQKIIAQAIQQQDQRDFPVYYYNNQSPDLQDNY